VYLACRKFEPPITLACSADQVIEAYFSPFWQFFAKGKVLEIFLVEWGNTYNFVRVEHPKRCKLIFADRAEVNQAGDDNFSGCASFLTVGKNSKGGAF